MYDAIFRYYETCTRNLQTITGRADKYWCAAPAQSDMNTEMTEDGTSNLCTEFLIPKDEGCNDHYEPVKMMLEYTINKGLQSHHKD